VALAYIAVRDALYPFAWLPCRPAHPLNLIPADAMVTGVWRIAWEGADRRAIGAHIAAMKASDAVNSIAMSPRLRHARPI
jgi:hypothetical protein